MTAETAEGGLRYTILALLDGREFERIQLDINAVPDDQHPLEHLELRDLPTDLPPTPDQLATNDAGTTHHLGSRVGILRT